MRIELNMNAVNQIPKDMVLYEKDELVQSICFVLKGRILVQAAGIRTILGSGSFLGICDLHSGIHKATYTAYDDLMVYVFFANNVDYLPIICAMNKDYGGLMVASMNRFIKEIYTTYQDLRDVVLSLRTFLMEKNQSYISFCKEHVLNVEHISVLVDKSVTEEMSLQHPKLVNYYNSCSEIPVEIQKKFYSCSVDICMYHVEEQYVILNDMMAGCGVMAEELYILARALILDERSLYRCYVRLAITWSRMGHSNGDLLSEIDKIIDRVNEVETIAMNKVGIELDVDRKSMEQSYFELLTGDMKEDQEHKEENTSVLQDSLTFILHYAEWDQDKCIVFENNMQKFLNSRDKMSSADADRQIRKEISRDFYIIYEIVFVKAYKDEQLPIIIDLFLRYGFMSEKLLSETQLKDLLYLKQVDDTEGPCQVYNVKEWLTLIWEGKKEPSKNEFDLDYEETLRELRKVGQIKQGEEMIWMADHKKKFQYEMVNMFPYNNRLLNGQPTSFIPILHEDLCIAQLRKVIMTADKINSAIRKLSGIDYSIFYRESTYTNVNQGVEREIIMTEVYPDIILLPTYGSKGIMWQEISGRKRDTPGRFLFPIFLDKPLDDILVGVYGRFRWELCRTMQGSRWNSIQVKSLTSEYSDYIQFYRKNKDLSEDRKEKLKAQIASSRNSTKEVFVKDYTDWVTRESSASIRLNKVVREIMATYCPFPKEIRQKISSQPIFQDAMAKFQRNLLKRSKEIESKCRYIERNGFTIPQEIRNTKEFFEK